MQQAQQQSFSLAKHGGHRPPAMRIYDDEKIVDLFAGGGGWSLGVELALGRSPDIAVNHDADAIAMHAANHPNTEHYQEDIYDVSPTDMMKGARCGLLVMSPDCFPAGTLVLTDNGYRPIEQVDVGDMVLTHQCRWRRVTMTMSSLKTVDKIRGYGHPGLVVSSEHPVYVRAGKTGEPRWVRAGEVDRGHYWAMPVAFPDSHVPSIPVSQKNHRETTITPELMWLAGRYVADGWTRLTDTRAELVITCGHHKTEALRSKISCWERTGARAGSDELAWHERDTATAHQFSTSHRSLVQWLREQFGHGAENKSLPGWLYGCPSELRRAFLDGYVAGDGYVQGALVVCSTVSKALAFSLRMLVGTLGYSASVYAVDNSRAAIIEGRHVNVKDAWSIRWRTEIAPGHKQTIRDSHLEWTPVRERTDGVADDVEVFNISVEEDESYVVEGVIVHNCTHFSPAKNGCIVRDREIRSLADVVHRWIAEVRPRVILLENVPEFTGWGQLDEDGRIIKERKGELFEMWWKRVERSGYRLSMRVLTACDYGAPTSRKRLFIIARCDGVDPETCWPEATHGPGRELPWRTAAECIDYSLPCPSIFMGKRAARKFTKETGIRCKRPLVKTTMRRIRRGLWKYVLKCARPFIVPVSHGAKSANDNRVHDLADPLRTITAANRGELAVVQPFISRYNGDLPGAERAQSLDAPLTTADTANRFGLVAPIVTPVKSWGGGGNDAAPGDRPMRTVTTSKRGEYALVAPTLVQTGYGERAGQAPRCLDLQQPLGTIIAGGDGNGNGKHALVAAFISKGFSEQNGGFNGASSLTDPLGTITTRDHNNLAVSFLTKLRGTSDAHMNASSLPVDQPVPTISAGGNHIAEVRAFLSKQCDDAIDDPELRAGILTLDGEKYQITDIGLRMFTARELFRCQGFPDSYIIDPITTRTLTWTRNGKTYSRKVTGPLTDTIQIEKCGNSVPPPMAAAIVRACFAITVAERQAVAA